MRTLPITISTIAIIAGAYLYFQPQDDPIRPQGNAAAGSDELKQSSASEDLTSRSVEDAPAPVDIAPDTHPVEKTSIPAKAETFRLLEQAMAQEEQGNAKVATELALQSYKSDRTNEKARSLYLRLRKTAQQDKSPDAKGAGDF